MITNINVYNAGQAGAIVHICTKKSNRRRRLLFKYSRPGLFAKFEVFARIVGAFFQHFFDAEKLVVFGNPVGAAR